MLKRIITRVFDFFFRSVRCSGVRNILKLVFKAPLFLLVTNLYSSFHQGTQLFKREYEVLGLYFPDICTLMMWLVIVMIWFIIASVISSTLVSITLINPSSLMFPSYADQPALCIFHRLGHLLSLVLLIAISYLSCKIITLIGTIWVDER